MYMGVWSLENKDIRRESVTCATREWDACAVFVILSLIALNLEMIQSINLD